MLATYFTYTVCAAALLRSVHAQKGVPADLSGGFDPNSISFQVSYTGDPENGFKDGTTFKKEDVSKEPEFAFGDASGISTSTKYTILLVDTTCDDARTLHYAKTNFIFDFDITSISSNATAVQEYKAPGAFGETGDGRQYSFLFYTQPGNKDVLQMKTPEEGKVFSVQQFQDDNNLVVPVAGVPMQVQLGGAVSCDGKGAASSGAASSVGQASSTPASAAASSGGSQTSSVVQDASSAAATSAPTATAKPKSSVGGFTTAVPGSLQGPSSTADDQSSGLVAASTRLVGASQTTQASAASGTASGTSTGAAATETGSASGLSLATAKCVVVASLIAFAGLLAF